MGSTVWTNNWSAFQNAALSGIFRSGWCTMTARNGALVTGWGGSTYQHLYSLLDGWGNMSSNGYFVIYGSGNDTPTAIQYDLSNPIASGVLQNVNTTFEEKSYNDETHIASRLMKFTVQNTSSNPVTIREWGLCHGSLLPTSVLLCRSVLDEPVTLAQYESATLTVTVSVGITNPI